MSFLEIRAPVLVLVLWLFSAICYIEPGAISTAIEFNAFIYLFAAILLWSKAILLLPVLIYTPVQSYTNISLFSTIIIFSLVVRFRAITQLSNAGLTAVVLSVAMAIYVALVTLVFGAGLDWSSRYFLPYVKIPLIALTIAVFAHDPKGARELLIYTTLLAGASIILKLLFQEQSQDITAASRFASDSVEALGSIYHQGAFEYRLLYALQEPNYTAVELLVALAIALLLLKHRLGAIVKYAVILSALSIVLQILGTFSRSGFISLIVLGVLHHSIISRNFPFAVAAVSSAALFVLIDDALVSRLSSIGADASLTGRTVFWGAALDLWLESPLFGNGLGSFLGSHSDAAHSTWLELLADLGIAGALFSALIVVSVARSLGGQVSKDEVLQRIVVLSPVFIILQTVTYYQLDLLIYYLGLLLFACVDREANQPEAAQAFVASVRRL